jgi:hypothetical protein
MMNFHWELCAPPRTESVCSNSEYAKGTTPSLLDKKRLEESKGFGETVSRSSPPKCKHAVSGAENHVPLHAVFERPCADLSIIDCLLRRFRSLLSKDEECDRPLHMAAMKGRLSML